VIHGMAGSPRPESESLNGTAESTTVIAIVAVFDGTPAEFA
jgi:hypothetical protein